MCLPPNLGRMCHKLDARSSDPKPPAAPALWAVLAPLRSVGVHGPRWEQHMRFLGSRIHNYITHMVGGGVGGVGGGGGGGGGGCGGGVVNTSPNETKTNENEGSAGRGVSCKR